MYKKPHRHRTDVSETGSWHLSVRAVFVYEIKMSGAPDSNSVSPAKKLLDTNYNLHICVNRIHTLTQQL